jgi:hypothetical protein
MLPFADNGSQEISTMQATETDIYWHSTCPCNQGRLLVIFIQPLNKLCLSCEECEATWVDNDDEEANWLDCENMTIPCTFNMLDNDRNYKECLFPEIEFIMRYWNVKYLKKTYDN